MRCSVIYYQLYPYSELIVYSARMVGGIMKWGIDKGEKHCYDIYEFDKYYYHTHKEIKK